MDIRELFANSGSPLFQMAGGTLRPRPAQADFAEAVSRGLVPAEDCVISMLQADTGIGKAIGYLLPAALQAAETGGRVIVSTHTIDLQEQIVAKALPLVLRTVAALTGRELSSVRRFGRRHYVHLGALDLAVQRFVSTADPADPRRSLLPRISLWCQAHPVSAAIPVILNEFGEQVEAAGGWPFALTSLTIGSGSAEGSGYRQMLAECQLADILIINHALLVTDLVYGSRVLLGDVSDGRPAVLIVDEADTLPEVAESMQGNRVPLRDIQGFVSDLAKVNPLLAEPIAKAFTSMKRSSEALAATHGAAVRAAAGGAAAILPISGLVDQAAVLSLARKIKRLAGLLGSVAADAATGIDLRHAADELQHDLASIGEAMRGVANGTDRWQTVGLYWTPVRQQPGLFLSGGETGGLLSRLWRREDHRLDAVVFVSATLGYSGASEGVLNLHDFGNRVGVKGKMLAGVNRGEFAPEHFGELDFVVMDQALAPRMRVQGDEELSEGVDPINPELVKWWRGMVEAAAQNGGRVLVLAASYREAELLGTALGGQGGRVIVEKRTDRDAIERFCAREDAILISPRRWAGLDLPGMIRHLVLTHIPFAPIDAVRNAALEHLLEQVGRKPGQIRSTRFPIILARAIQKTRQGLGRAIRSDSDRATIWICDPRWPVPVDRLDRQNPHQPRWSRALEGAVPSRFREALRTASIWSPLQGVRRYKPTKSRLAQSKKALPAGISAAARRETYGESVV
jgi:hypothetical protein